mmetsp:Transcript_11405/g.30720  ORF Transcript_11405/g.30720 Transcript_11405/m.30720 type:complete len:128 (+) Transcript_11405:128-511(+)
MAEPAKKRARSGNASPACLRLMTDLRLIQREPPEGCSASPVSDDDLFLWAASIIGPSDSPWEGGCFALRLKFNENYPAKPPHVRFTSEMFHPNVYTDGTLCLDIIQDKWRPVRCSALLLFAASSMAL